MIRWLPALALCVLAVPVSAETVRYAIDGDSLVMATGERVRVTKVDAPEMHGKCAVEIELAIQAKAFTARFVDGGVELVRLPKPDRYGRTLAAVIHPDGRDLAQALIAARLARPYCVNGNRCERRSGWC